MGNVVSFILTAIDKYTIWIYLFCFVISLIYFRNFIVARRNRNNSPYTIEREVAAHREGRAMSGIGVMMAVAVMVTGAKMFLLPGIDIASLSVPTATLTLPAATKVFATLTPATTVTPAESVTPRPTREVNTGNQETVTPTEQVKETPLPTSRPVPASCPDSNAQIVSPSSGETVSGQVTIFGSANHAQFQFYKVEYSLGDDPGEWHVIGDLHRQPASDGVLETLNTAALPNGPVWVQVTVVDQSGNFPAPCRIKLFIQN